MYIQGKGPEDEENDDEYDDHDGGRKNTKISM